MSAILLAATSVLGYRLTPEWALAGLAFVVIGGFIVKEAVGGKH